MNVTIAPMSIDHYDQVYALWQSTEGLCLGEADRKEQIARHLQRNSGCSFIAELEGEIIGAVLCGHDGRRGLIYHLAVAKEHRNRGIGSRLVEHCLSALEAAGVALCHLFVLDLNRSAISFWEKNGWKMSSGLAAFSRSPTQACASTPSETTMDRQRH